MRTDTGVLRKRNEDSAHVDSKHRFFIVADGMGGHCAGDVASELAVSVVRTALEAATETIATLAAATGPERREKIPLLLEEAVRAADSAVLEQSRAVSKSHGMGTTLDVVLLVGNEAFVAHVGDSRTYLVRDRELRQTTMDHTVAQVMVTAGALPPEALQTSPMRSVLCNSVGCQPGLEVEHIYLQLEPGDRLLICTDGLYEYFDRAELAERVACGSGDTVLAGLIDDARERGGHDNITGILVELATAAAMPDAELDDAPTIPIAVTVDPTSRGPLAGLSDEALSAIVERVLRESSRPHRLPCPRQC